MKSLNLGLDWEDLEPPLHLLKIFGDPKFITVYLVKLSYLALDWQLLSLALTPLITYPMAGMVKAGE